VNRADATPRCPVGERPTTSTTPPPATTTLRRRRRDRRGTAGACAALASALALALPGPSGATQAERASLSSRLISCDARVVRQAIRESLDDPRTLREPTRLFEAALAERVTGRSEEAAFLFVSAWLRTARQMAFASREQAQVLSIFMSQVGPLVYPVLEADPVLGRRVIARVIEWDRVTPDPVRDRESRGTGAEKLAAIDRELARLAEGFVDDADRMARARQRVAEVDRQVESLKAVRCAPGTLDAPDRDAADAWIRSTAEHWLRSQPFVVARATEGIASVRTGAASQAPGRLPTRLTVRVESSKGSAFYAEVDVAPRISPERRLLGVTLTMACVTDLWIGQREGLWKDVCVDDPNARRPAPDAPGTRTSVEHAAFAPRSADGGR
jgi:hypothetical protein